MKDAKKLAELLTKNIMLFHDSADYSGLEKNSMKLLMEMGHSKIVSTKVAELIRKIYVSYDSAQAEFERGNFSAEIKLYSNAKVYAADINKLVGGRNDSRLLVDIVINWRHRNKVSAILKFFIFWKNSLPLFSALLATFYQLSAAYCHDKRNLIGFENNFLKIYKLLLTQNELPVLF